MGAMDEQKIFEILNEYYNNKSLLLTSLFSGDFIRKGSSGRKEIKEGLEKIDEPRPDRFFKNGHLQKKWINTLKSNESNQYLFFNNIKNLISGFQDNRITELLNKLTPQAKLLGLEKYISSAATDKDICSQLVFIMFMCCIEGPVDFFTKNIPSIEIASPSDNNSKTDEYWLCSYCPSPKPNMVNGYGYEINEVCEHLIQRNTNKIALVGMPGTGKSEMAKAIANRLSTSFSIRLWISSASNNVSV